MTDQIINEVREAIFVAAGGRQNFLDELPFMFRQAFDELIDTPRTRRLLFEELDANEKAVLGIRVEAALRQILNFPRGKLDFLIGDHDVDVKFTSVNNWMIPPEAIGHACILCQANEAKSLFSVGLAIAGEGNLTQGQNRDKKRSFSKAGKENIHWLAYQETFPANVWQSVSIEEVNTIFGPSSGTERIVALFELFEGEALHRSVIQAVARQVDYMKRIRSNQGARDDLHPKGIIVLSGTQDGPLLREMGIKLGRDFVMAYRPTTQDEIDLILSKPRHAKNFIPS